MGRVQRRALVTAMGGVWTPARWGASLAFLAIAKSGAAWVDTSGNGITINEAGTPDYTTVTTPNGHPAILFDGSTDYYTADALAAAFTGVDKPFTAVHVFRSGVGDGYYTWYSLSSSAAANPFQSSRRGGHAYNYFRRDDAGTLINPYINYTYTVADKWFCLIESFTGTTVSTWLNGTPIQNAVASDVGQTTLNRFTIGALRLNAGASQYWNNAMALSMFRTAASVQSDVDQINAWVLRRFGVPSS